MPSYLVQWRIDIAAASPEQAAQFARHIQLDERSIATVFDVYDEDGNGFEIDLDLIEPTSKEQ